MATMNEAIGAAIKQIEAARKPEDTVPWKPDTPHPQPLYVFSPTTQTWTPSPSVSASSAAPAVAKLALFTWNIDFMLPHGPSRMSAALAELHARIAALDPATAALVFLQECVAADLDLLGATDWVRAGFARTDVGNAAWASEMYGTTTLVDRRLGVRGVFRAHFGSTRMERDGLFVDVVFPGGSVGDGEGEKVVRLCNTHLESLAQEPPFRPPQVAVAARFMKEEGVHGALRTFFSYIRSCIRSFIHPSIVDHSLLSLSPTHAQLPLIHHSSPPTPTNNPPSSRRPKRHPTLRPHPARGQRPARRLPRSWRRRGQR